MGWGRGTVGWGRGTVGWGRGTVGWGRQLTWCDEILDTVSIPTETSHVDGEHPIGTVPAGRGRGRGGEWGGL